MVCIYTGYLVHHGPAPEIYSHWLQAYRATLFTECQSATPEDIGVWVLCINRSYLTTKIFNFYPLGHLQPGQILMSAREFTMAAARGLVSAWYFQVFCNLSKESRDHPFSTSWEWSCWKAKQTFLPVCKSTHWLFFSLWWQRSACCILTSYNQPSEAKIPTFHRTYIS